MLLLHRARAGDDRRAVHLAAGVRSQWIDATHGLSASLRS